MRSPATLFPGYKRLDGAVPVVYQRGMEEQAAKVLRLLEMGTRTLCEVLEVEEPPVLEAFLVPDKDWSEAPRESTSPYPRGLPYFTRSVSPPALVLPETLSPAFRPRTWATCSLVVWHELTHAFMLRREVIRLPAWLQEFVPQAAAAAIARRTGLPLNEHLGKIDREPSFTVRGLRGHADADGQIAFQNLLLLLGTAAVEEFGEEFLGRLVRELWKETEVVDEGRAEELLADSLGTEGWEWLKSRPEF